MIALLLIFIGLYLFYEFLWAISPSGRHFVRKKGVDILEKDFKKGRISLEKVSGLTSIYFKDCIRDFKETGSFNIVSIDTQTGSFLFPYKIRSANGLRYCILRYSKAYKIVRKKEKELIKAKEPKRVTYN